MRRDIPDLGQVMLEFIGQADAVADDGLEDCYDSVIEGILDNLCLAEFPEQSAEPFAELNALFLERTDGDMFLLSDLVERSVGYVDADSARNLLPNILALAPYGLSASYDPEDYLTVLDDLGCTAATALNESPDEVTEDLCGRLSRLKGRFTERFMDLDDSGFLRIADKIESDEYGEIPEALRDYLLDGDERLLNRFISLFFD